MVEFYEESGINPKYFSGQCYDGASNLQSEKKGVASFILKELENVVITHCCMHNLNLSIYGSVRIQLIDSAIESYKNSIFIFKLSPKKEALLNYIAETSRLDKNRQEKLTGMCKARWSERDLAYEHFYLPLPFTVEALEIINRTHTKMESFEKK